MTTTVGVEAEYEVPGVRVWAAESGDPLKVMTLQRFWIFLLIYYHFALQTHVLKIPRNTLADGDLPRTPLGELTALPIPPLYSIDLEEFSIYLIDFRGKCSL